MLVPADHLSPAGVFAIWRAPVRATEITTRC
jgi:hypothetical protein